MTVSPFLDVLRDIARGGFTGIIVGIFVAGLGGRIVMRLATILHEDAVNSLTENGEVIGRISLNGTLALMTFGGLGMGLLAGVIWVTVGPWLPGRGLRRATITAALAVAVGSPPLIQRFNPDFVVLDHDPLVVAMLVALVAAVGFSMAMVDGALDRRLPPAIPGAGLAGLYYAIVSVLGLTLLVPVFTIMFDQSEYAATIRVGWGILAVGLCTLASWWLRMRGRPERPRALVLVARGALVVTATLGLVTSVPHILGAAGVR